MAGLAARFYFRAASKHAKTLLITKSYSADSDWRRYRRLDHRRSDSRLERSRAETEPRPFFPTLPSFACNRYFTALWGESTGGIFRTTVVLL